MNTRHAQARSVLSFLYAGSPCVGRLYTRALCAGSLVLLLAGCGSTVDSNGENSTAQTADRECRTTGSPGTKMKRSVCMSAEEWAIADARGQEQEDLRNEYFRRVRESSTLGAASEFSATSSGGL